MDYFKELEDLKKELKDLKKELKEKYIKKNEKFKKGDIIQGITGIIKVEKIDLDIFEKYKNINFIYTGTPFKKIKNKLLRTKQTIKSITDYNNLKRIKSDE